MQVGLGLSLYNPALTGRRPPLQGNTKFAAWGDSFTAAKTIGSFLEWDYFEGAYRFYVDANSNQGVSGNTSTQALARSANVLAVGAGLIHILIGTNDPQAGILAGDVSTSGTTIYNVQAMIDVALNSGATVILGTPTNRIAPSALTAPQQAELDAYTAWIRTKASAKVRIADYQAVYNPLNHAYDGLHPNYLGANVMKAVLLPIMMGLIDQSFTPLFATQTDPANKIPNPTMAGSNVITEGVIADNLTLTVPAAMAGKVAASKGTLADGSPAQVLTFSGAPPASATDVTLAWDAATVNGVNNDYWELFCAYEMIGLNGVLSLLLDLGAGSYGQAFTALTGSTIITPAATKSGILRSHPVKLTGSVPTMVARHLLKFHNNSGDIGGNIAGAIKIGLPGIRKVA